MHGRPAGSCETDELGGQHAAGRQRADTESNAKPTEHRIEEETVSGIDVLGQLGVLLYERFGFLVNRPRALFNERERAPTKSLGLAVASSCSRLGFYQLSEMETIMMPTYSLNQNLSHGEHRAQSSASSVPHQGQKPYRREAGTHFTYPHCSRCRLSTISTVAHGV